LLRSRGGRDDPATETLLIAAFVACASDVDGRVRANRIDRDMTSSSASSVRS
jgi:hypothetical protein